MWGKHPSNSTAAIASTTPWALPSPLPPAPSTLTRPNECFQPSSTQPPPSPWSKSSSSLTSWFPSSALSSAFSCSLSSSSLASSGPSSKSYTKRGLKKKWEKVFKRTSVCLFSVPVHPQRQPSSPHSPFRLPLSLPLFFFFGQQHRCVCTPISAVDSAIVGLVGGGCWERRSECTRHLGIYNGAR